MMELRYTYIYVAAWAVCLCGCVSRQTAGSRAEATATSAATLRTGGDSLRLQHLQQSEAATSWCYRRVSLSAPDSVGRQYVRHVTTLEADQAKKERTYTHLEQKKQEKTTIKQQAQRQLKEEHTDEKGAGGRWWQGIWGGVAVFLLGLTVCLPAVKRVMAKILSK